MDLQIDLSEDAPRGQELERALRAAIRSGRLAPGSTLPPSRLLAQELGVSRGVVVDSYSQLIAEGYLAAKRGSGTRVAARTVPEPAPTRLDERLRRGFRHDLRPGQPDFHAFPRRRWQAALIDAVQSLPDARLTYSDYRGAPELRAAVAAYLARARAVAADPERVVICCGAAHGTAALCHALRARGARRVAIEDPGWRLQRLTVERAGLEPVPVGVDAEGLIVSELAQADVDAVMVTPAHQYPTGVVLSRERRTALVEWAQGRDALIIEDDYDAEYRFDRDPTASLQALAPDRVAFVGTTSKTLAPAMRIGWVVAPSYLLAGVQDELRITDARPPTVDQIAMASFIEDAALDRHLRAMRRRYAVKRELLINALARHTPEIRLGGAAAGLHLVAWLPHYCDERDTARRLRAAGVGVHELHRHCTTYAPVGPALLLGYALPTGAQIEAAVPLLATAINGERQAA